MTAALIFVVLFGSKLNKIVAQEPIWLGWYCNFPLVTTKDKVEVGQALVKLSQAVFGGPGYAEISVTPKENFKLGKFTRVYFNNEEPTNLVPGKLVFQLDPTGNPLVLNWVVNSYPYIAIKSETVDGKEVWLQGEPVSGIKGAMVARCIPPFTE